MHSGDGSHRKDPAKTSPSVWKNRKLLIGICVVVIAVVLQVVPISIFTKPQNVVDHVCNITVDAAKDAIKRAQSQSCKNELTQFACRLEAGTVYPTSLQSTCLQSSETSSSSWITKPPSSVRILYVLTVRGRDIFQVSRLLRLIHHADHFFLIHVDKRDDYLYQKLWDLQSKVPNIFVLQNRRSPIWGGASLLPTLLDAMREALRDTNWKWDYFINLSESDLPVKDNEALVAYLAENYGRNFVKSHGKDPEQFIKSQGLKFSFYECDNHLYKMGPRELPQGIVVDGGSDWVVLHRSFCEYVASSQPDPLVSGLLKVFNFTLLPAESFFHTALKNSKFCDTVINGNLKFTNWNRAKGCNCQHRKIVDWCGCSPNVIRMRDMKKLNALANQAIFFARKFDPVVDFEVITAITLPKTSKEARKIRRHLLNLFSFSEKLSSSELETLLECLGKLSVKESNVEIRELYVEFSESGQRRLLLTARKPVEEEGGEHLVEILFSVHNPFSLITSENSVRKDIQKRILDMQVGTDFDEKEKLFRNYVRILGPMSDPVLQILMDSEETVTTQIIWTDPIGIIAGSFEVNVSSTEDAPHIPSFSKPLRPGIWKVLLLHNWKPIAQTEFLVIPAVSDQTLNRGPIEGRYLPHDFATVYSVLGLPVPKVRKEDEIDDADIPKNREELVTWTKGLVEKFYILNDFCEVAQNDASSGCRSTEWSSFSFKAENECP